MSSAQEIGMYFRSGSEQLEVKTYKYYKGMIVCPYVNLLAYS
jgi:hypothetical protein